MLMAGEKPVGRAQLDIVYEKAKIGLSKPQVARALGWGVSTWYEKCATYPELAEKYEAGRLAGVEEISNELYQLAKDGDGPSQRFYLERRDPENWGRQTKIDANVKADVTTRELPVDAKSMTPEQRAHLRALLPKCDD